MASSKHAGLSVQYAAAQLRSSIWRYCMTTAADFMAATLEQAGVKRIYGVVGDSLNGFTDALRRCGKIDWIHMRHEEGAAFAAGAEAHLTGELAVCAGSCGPGNLHLINGLFDCQRSGVPVLAIAAHIPSSEIGIDYFQATHPETLVQGMQPLCRAGLQPRAVAADPDPRDPRRGRQARRRGGGHPRRRGAEAARRRRCRTGSCPTAPVVRPSRCGSATAGGAAERRHRASRCCAAPAARARMTRWSRWRDG